MQVCYRTPGVLKQNYLTKVVAYFLNNKNSQQTEHE